MVLDRRLTPAIELDILEPIKEDQNDCVSFNVILLLIPE